MEPKETKTLAAVLVLVVLLTGFVSAPGEEVRFQYGVVGKHAAKHDSLFEVTDGATLQSGDSFKINFILEQYRSFYVILESSSGEFYLYHSKSRQASQSGFGTASTVLDWLELDSQTGSETIYLIAAEERFTNLENLFIQNENANGKRKKQLNRKIRNELRMITLTDTTSGTVLQTRLDLPNQIGATFREGSDGTTPNSVFNRCEGKGKAFTTIRIEHK